MNAKLGELLTAAGLRGDPLRWSAVLIAHNLGAIPPPARSEADEIRHRGFYLLLLDGHGKPTHFCKCRPVTDDELTHETALLEVLCADPHLRTIVPQTRGVRTRQMLMQVSAYLPGPTYLREVGRQSDRAWEQSMREILGAAGLLAERAMALAPWLAADSEPLKLQSLGSGPLQELVALGLTPERANALE